MIAEGKEKLGGTKPITDTPRPNATPSPYTAYAAFAEEFVQNTIDIDMSEIYEPFLAHLPPDSLILDVGAGSGRDSKAFLDRGYDVVALEPDAALAAMAVEYINYYVVQETVQKYKPSASVRTNGGFDGIWASASLLHIAPEELPAVIEQLTHWLKVGGVLYCSFKYAEGEMEVHEKRGLHYTYLNEQTFDKLLPAGRVLDYQRIWVTNDRRPERQGERWLNVLLTKVHDSREEAIDVMKMTLGHLEAQHRAAIRNEDLRQENERLQEQLATMRGKLIAVLETEWRKSSATESGAILRCIKAIERVGL